MDKENSERILFPLRSPFSDRKRAFFVFATKVATIVRDFLGSDQKAELDSLLAQLEKETTPFRECKLKDAGGDLKKRWHIEYYAFDADSNILVRRRQYMPAELKTKSERVRFFQEFKADVDTQLREGKTYTTQPKKQSYATTAPTIWSLLDLSLSDKKAKIKNEKTVKGFIYSADLVKEWLSFSEQRKLLAKDFDRNKVYELIDWIQDDFNERNEKRMTNRTFNNYKNNIQSLFSELVERGHFVANPLSIIRNRQVEEAANFPFNEAQKQTILSYLLSNGQMCDYYFCSFMYYTCSRPTEIIKLKRKNIFKDKILFQGGLAKNKKVKYIPITEGCRSLLDKMGVLDTSPEAYLFSKNGTIGGFEKTGENWFGKRHTLVLDALGMRNGDYTMYSWKDTGACDLYLATKDIMLVKDMCRHSTVAYTEVYLRSMGMLIDDIRELNTPRLGV
jgi:integrase